MAGALGETRKACGIHRVRPGEFLDIFDVGRAAEGVAVHVVVEAAVLGHAPADPPLVVEEAIAGQGLFVDHDLEGGRRTGRHVAAVAAQPLAHVVVHHGDLLEDVHHLDFLVGEAESAAQVAVRVDVDAGQYRAAQIERNAVSFFVLQGQFDPLARIHNASYLLLNLIHLSCCVLRRSHLVGQRRPSLCPSPSVFTSRWPV